jgi:hypothetical protein
LRKATILLLLILVCFSNILAAKSKAEKQLQTNITQWAAFQAEGSILVNYPPYAIRKFFVFARDASAARLDILDSGLIGFNPAPMVTLYLQDKIILSAPGIKELQGIDPNWYIPAGTTQKLLALTDSLFAHSAEILAKRQAVINGITLSFDKKYRLSALLYPQYKVSAKVEYTRKNKPSKLSFYYHGKETAILNIDKIRFQDIDISPLELP